jgi:hypothetical protein
MSSSNEKKKAGSGHIRERHKSKKGVNRTVVGDLHFLTESATLPSLSLSLSFFLVLMKIHQGRSNFTFQVVS